MTRTNQILVTVLAAVVAGAGFYMLALKPKREEAADLKKQVATAQQELDAARALLATNEQARAGYREAYAAVVRLGKAVPAGDDVRSMLVQLNEAASESDVDFRTISMNSGATAPTAGAAPTADAAVALPPGATVGPAGFPVMPFQFNFEGGFFGLSDFFERVHSFVDMKSDELSVSGRLVTLDAFQLEPDQEEGFPKMQVQVNATTYLVSPLEGLTGGATASGPAGASPSAAGTTPAPSGSAPAPAPSTATSTGAIR